MDLLNITRETEKISYTDKHCMVNLMNEWTMSPPFAHKKILMNIHLTLSSLLLVELFLKSGADFFVTCTNQLVCHPPIKELLNRHGWFISPEQLPQFSPDHFDVVLDCGACLTHIFQPKFGFVELTQVNPKSYNGSQTKVLNIDSSFVKQIETYFGTGNGFVRAIDVICEETKLDLLQLNFLIFGFGKVGKGIYHSLRKAGISKEQLMVAEVSPHCISRAKNQDIKIFNLKEEKDTLLTLLNSKIDCAVTATGLREAISRDFSHDDFKRVKILANMGTDDEWGEAFSQDHVYYAKRPINFMLEHPTLVKYLDPIFTLYALAVMELMHSVGRKTEKIFYPSQSLQRRIMMTWLNQNIEYETEIHKLWSENFSTSFINAYDDKNRQE